MECEISSIGNEGERIYEKAVFNLGLEICTVFWEVDMLGNVTQVNVTGVGRNRNT